MPNRNELPYPKVEIYWKDINSSDDTWISNSNIENHDVAYCKDIAYLYSQDDIKVITFSSYSYHDDGSFDVNNLVAYPRGCIERIEKI